MAKEEKRVEQYETEQMAIYCNGCEKGSKDGGGHPIHMIELISECLP